MACYLFGSKPLLEPMMNSGRFAWIWMFNSLAPGRPGCHYKTAIFNLVLLIGIFTSSKDNALRWMPWHLTDDKSTLVQVMAWCSQTTSHYLSQCWPTGISMSPYGVTRPQWVNSEYFKSCWLQILINIKHKQSTWNVSDQVIHVYENNNLNKKIKQFFERENYIVFLLNLTQKRSNALFKSAETKSKETEILEKK